MKGKIIIPMLMLFTTLSCYKEHNLLHPFSVQVSYTQEKPLWTGRIDTIEYDLIYDGQSGSVDQFVEDGGYLQLATDGGTSCEIIGFTSQHLIIRSVAEGLTTFQINAYQSGQLSYGQVSVVVRDEEIVYEFKGDIYRMRPDGSNMVNVTQTIGMLEKDPGISFDGSRILYLEGNKVVVANRSNNHLATINLYTIGSNNTYSAPNFVGDATDKIFFKRGDFLEISDLDGNITTFSEELASAFYVQSEQSEKHAVIEYNGYNSACQLKIQSGTYEPEKTYSLESTNLNCPEINHVEMSRDGEKVLIGDGRKIILFDKSLGLTDITPYATHNKHPSFNYNGDKVVFSSDIRGDYDLYIMDIDKSNIIQITDTPEDELNPQWR